MSAFEAIRLEVADGVDQPVLTPGNPVRFAGEDPVDVAPPPTLGQHTDEVLRAAGYSDAALAELRARKIVR